MDPKRSRRPSRFVSFPIATLILGLGVGLFLGTVLAWSIITARWWALVLLVLSSAAVLLGAALFGLTLRRWVWRVRTDNRRLAGVESRVRINEDEIAALTRAMTVALAESPPKLRPGAFDDGARDVDRGRI